MTPSLETLAAQFADHQVKCDQDKAVVTKEIEKIQVSLEGKVTYEHFYWVLGILVTILIALLGYLAFRMDGLTNQGEGINKTVGDIQSNVSFLKGKLEPYDVQYTK